MACAVGPDYKGPPSIDVADVWHALDAPEDIAEKDVQYDWWRVFDDALLEEYIKQAAQHNKDLEIARANIAKSRAQRREAIGGFFPAIDGGMASTKSRTSEKIGSGSPGAITKMHEAGFDATWELDVFGGTRRDLQAANARLGASMAGYQDTMLSVLAEVARNYYEARGLQKRITITKESAELLKRTADVIKARVDAGVSTEFDLSRANAQYQATKARIPNLEAQWQSSLYALAVLLGRVPESLLKDMQAAKPLPVPDDFVPVGLRSDILRRRPDIREAERNLAASVADIGVQTAELFPKFSLTGSATGKALVFGDVFTAAAGAWSLGSIMQWSIFEGGAIRARIDASEADSKAALASYEKTVLSALADVESSLVNYGKEIATRRLLGQSLKSRSNAARMAQELFDAGETDYLAVLDAERELVAAKDDMVVSETQGLLKLVSLYKALGGGWQHFDEDGLVIKDEILEEIENAPESPSEESEETPAK